MEGKFKENKGITLIALVITIIIILIIAGVAIASLTGENGLLARASKTKEATTMGAEKDKIGVGYHDYKIKKYSDSNATLEVQGASVTGDEQSGWTIKFNDTKNRYKLSTEGTINEAKPTITVAHKSEDDYEGRPKYEAEKIEYKSIKVDNNTLECEVYTGNSDETDKVTSDIQKYDGMIDMINAGFLIYSEEFVPGFFVDSNWKIVSDFNNLADDDYYLFAIQNEDEINDLMSGNYVMEHSRWVSGWNDRTYLNYHDLIGYNGISTTIAWACLGDGPELNYMDDLFDSTVSTFERLKASGDIVLSHTGAWGSTDLEFYNDRNGNYYGYLGKDMSIDSYPVIGINGLALSEYHGGGILYDANSPRIDNVFFPPEKIRLKSTKEEISQEEYDSGFTGDIGSWTHTPSVDEYEFYYENKWYAIEKGHAISL